MRFRVYFILFLMPFQALAAQISHNFDRNPAEPTLSFSGAVEVGDARLLKEKLQEFKGKKLTLVLNSPGGLVFEGKQIIETLQDLKKQGVALTTSVKNGTQCGSICLPIYLAGETRKAGTHSSFYFHGVTHAFCNIPNESLTEEYVQLLKSLGASEKLIQHLMAEEAFSTPGEYWMSGKELAEEGDGFVTELSGRHSKLTPQCPNRYPARPR